MVFGKQPLQGIESHPWDADRVREENISRIHDVGHPQGDSKIDEKYTVRT